MNLQQQINELPDTAKHAVDAISVGVVVGTILQWLPAVAAIFTIIWTAIRIYETPTVQGMLKRLRKQ